jgi:HAD superfamily hydrolase (TIGR01549 family)
MSKVIKGIFFDWFNTLAHYDPPREEVYRSAFKEQGIELSFGQVYRGLLEGDRQFFSLRAQGFVKSKHLSEIEDVLTLYPLAICKVAGVSVSPDINVKILRQALKNFNSQTVLYKDVLPLFSELKNKNYILGIITNADQAVIKLINGLGLGSFLNVIITSEGARAEKPDAAIFNAAYLQAGLKPDEMLYIGDQYNSDVLGAKQAGSQAILLDRYNLAPEIMACPRISSLDQVLDII